MGNAHHDGASQVIRCQQDALSTVQRIQNELDETDLVLHLGDISYARGYASVVCRLLDMVSLAWPL